MLIGSDQLPQLDERRFNGAPYLVVEVVSAGSVREDKVRKFTEYEQAGVREYWIIDPRLNQQTAEFYRLNDEGILDPVELNHDGRFYSQVLPQFWLRVEWLWQTPMPRVEAALADIFESDPAFPPELGRLYRGLADRLT
jgi:Uma2 family endonuclease